LLQILLMTSAGSGCEVCKSAPAYCATCWTKTAVLIRSAAVQLHVSWQMERRCHAFSTRSLTAIWSYSYCLIQSVNEEEVGLASASTDVLPAGHCSSSPLACLGDHVSAQ
jgi:hypothetical protein